MRLRLRTQHLTGPPLATPEAVVGWLGAVQAQEYAAAKWGIGQRVRGVTEADLDRSLAAGKIVRTHVLRPTWHFVLPVDLRWMTALTAPRVNARMAYYDRQLSLTAAVQATANAIIGRALAGGRHLTRAELAAALRRGGVAAEGQRLSQLMMRAELDLVVCSGVVRGGQHTYALVDERAPAGRDLRGDDALAELTRRYFHSHGPATAKDYAWWATTSLAEARRAIALVEHELERVTIGGRLYWRGEARRPPAVRSPRALLLQGYDEYIIAYTESRDVVAGAPGPAGVLGDRRFTHVVTIDGRVAGHWRRAGNARAAAVEVGVVRPLTGGERDALDRELARYARFVGLPAAPVRFV